MMNDEAKRLLGSARLMLLRPDGQPVSDLYDALTVAIEALDAVAEVPRWIPVTERLPERADEVLIAYLEEYDDWTGEYVVSTATYMPRAGRWDYDNLKITHWMPRPKAPDLT